MKEKIKTFRKYGVTLDIFDENIKIDGHWKLSYELRVKRQVIFSGNDFYSSPLHAINSIETVKSILTFLTLQCGDTDSEYFDNYTQLQNDFMYSNECENVRLWLTLTDN